MNVDTLRARLQHFPKLSLTKTPTPIQPLSQFQSQILDKSSPFIYIKRDDEIGPGLGGNKGRKLDYLLAEAIKLKKTKVITFGGLQSNHARMTAAACAALALDAHLFYFDHQPAELSGNLLLSKLFGAKMHFIPIGGGSSGTMTLETTNRMVRLVSWPFTGMGSYFIPVGGHNTIGGLGYVEAACELEDQITTMGLEPDKVTIVVPAGTGGTLAGLISGFSLMESPIKILGIDIGKLWKGFPRSVARLSTALCTLLGVDSKFHEHEIPLIEKTYAGKKYAYPSEAGWKAIRLLAHTEGILLDPVYTGKAFAGMIDLIRKGFFKVDEHLIFLHSGGFPTLGLSYENYSVE